MVLGARDDLRILLLGQGGATAAAEPSQHAGRRLVDLDGAAQDPKAGLLDPGPGDRQRAGRPGAGVAIADRRPNRRPAHLIAQLTAETAAGLDLVHAHDPISLICNRDIIAKMGGPMIRPLPNYA